MMKETKGGAFMRPLYAAKSPVCSTRPTAAAPCVAIRPVCPIAAPIRLGMEAKKQEKPRRA